MEKTPVFTSDEAIAGLRQAVHAKAGNFYAMYSSVLGGIVQVNWLAPGWPIVDLDPAAASS